MNLTDDFRLANLQAVIFTPDIASFNNSRFIAGVLQHHADRYGGGDIESLPFPSGDAKWTSVPSVQISSADGQWMLKAASGRIDSLWKRPLTSDSINKTEIVKQALAPLVDYVRDCTVQVGRIALVINRFAVVDEPSRTLIGRFCIPDTWDAGSSEAPLRNSRAFEIHNLKRYALTLGIEVNSWVRCRAGAANERPAVLFEQDINTLAEQSHEKAFTPPQIEEFFESAVRDADNILQLYFPTGIKNARL